MSEPALGLCGRALPGKLQGTGAMGIRGAARVLESAGHLFGIDERVQITPDIANPKRSQGVFRVVRHMPPLGAAFQYRLQSEADAHEEVVLESQLERAAPLP